MSLSPELYSPDARTRLLVVAPHPDDETIGTGELLQVVRAAGGEVRVLLLTDGDDNPWPQRWLERRLSVRDADRARWGRRRRGEAAQALRRLNIPADALHAIGWPDMGLTALLREQPAFARARLIEELTSFRPTVVALPALSDRHPDHGSAHVLVRLALAAGGVEPPLLLGYLVHGRESPAPRLALSPAGAWHAAKLAALSAHASQMALSAGRMRRLADRPERYERVARPPLGRRAGALPWRPGILRARLRLTVASPDGVRHWRWADAPLQQRDGQGHYRLTEVPTAPCFARLDMAVASPWIFDRWGWCEL